MKRVSDKENDPSEASRYVYQPERRTRTEGKRKHVLKLAIDAGTQNAGKWWLGTNSWSHLTFTVYTLLCVCTVLHCNLIWRGFTAWCLHCPSIFIWRGFTALVIECIWVCHSVQVSFIGGGAPLNLCCPPSKYYLRKASHASPHFVTLQSCPPLNDGVSTRILMGCMHLSVSTLQCVCNCWVWVHPGVNLSVQWVHSQAHTLEF